MSFTGESFRTAGDFAWMRAKMDAASAARWLDRHEPNFLTDRAFEAVAGLDWWRGEGKAAHVASCQMGMCIGARRDALHAPMQVRMMNQCSAELAGFLEGYTNVNRRQNPERWRRTAPRVQEEN